MLRTVCWGAVGAGLFASVVGMPKTARACGGFFCNAQQPVVQTGEAIIFAVDPETQSVEATINIAYSGSASDFAWLLPLQAAPTAIDVGPSRAFGVAQQLTSPQFILNQVDTVGICGGNDMLVAMNSDSGNRSPTAGGEGANVLQQSQVGPYDTVTLAGKDAAAVREWLVDAKYVVTDKMMDAVTPYLAKGDVLLALKLQKNQAVGDIQPIKLSIPVAEACVPIRLTAIAAQDDMQVLVYMLSNQGRAIPENYYHVTPNLTRIDWLRGGANYNQVISEAVDEGTGNAFTTEYAGPSNIFAGLIFQPGRINIDALAAATRIDDFLRSVAQAGLLSRSEILGILGRAVSDSALVAIGVTRDQFNQCIMCYAGRFGAETLNAKAAAEEIRTRILEPEEKAQKVFDKYNYFTRLNTFISPEEMTIDPIFAFNANLPNVSNVHQAKAILDCGLGGSPGSAGVEIVLEDGRRIAFDSRNSPTRTVLDGMPAAERVEQLAQGLLVRDNSGAISDMLDDHNANSRSGCGCASRTHTHNAMFGGLALVGLLAFVHVARRRLRSN